MTALEWTLLPLAVTLSLVALLALRRVRSLRHDLKTLSLITRALLGSGRPPSATRLSDPLSRAIGSHLLTLHHQHSADPTQSGERALTPRARPTRAGQSAASTEQFFAQLILEMCPEDVVACALLSRDSSGNLFLAGGAGAEIERMREVLLVAAHEAYNSSDGRTTFLSPSGILDLSLFGIGASIFIPAGETKTERLLWLGLSRHARGLPPEQNFAIRLALDHALTLLTLVEETEHRASLSEGARKDLLALSHDLRSPGLSALFALRSFVAEQGEDLGTEHGEQLRVIESALQEQLSLIGDFLDYARHERSALKAHRRVHRLKDVLTEVLDRYRLECRGSSRTFVDDIPSDIEVCFDGTHLRRIVGNLLSNALKFTPSGSVTVSAVREESFIELRIEDTGIGIPEGERTKLFCEFTRLGNSRAIPGCGLGLSVAKLLAEINGGYLRYEPSVRQGSVFILGLEPRSFAEKPIHPDNTDQRQLELALVIDDDPFALRSSTRLTECFAPRTAAVSGAREAKEFLAHNLPDLIVTDWHLGDGTFHDVLAALPAQERSPFILILTGERDLPDLAAYRDVYRVGVLQKPVGREEFSEVMRAAFPHLSASSTIQSNSSLVTG